MHDWRCVGLYYSQRDERERNAYDTETKALLSCAVAAALLLSGCRKGSSNSGSMSSSNAMSGSSGSASTTQTGGWKTGLGILTEASDEARTGTIHTIAAAVLLDGDGKLADVMLDELEVEVTADGKGVVTMPTDYRTKRQKGDDYPLAAASSLKRAGPSRPMTSPTTSPA